jgi:hypothetical protein
MPGKTQSVIVCFLAILLFTLGCQTVQTAVETSALPAVKIFPDELKEKPLAPDTPEAVKKMLESAKKQTTLTKTYDPAYVVLDYPNGDIAIEKGVCTDVVIRALRAAGVDLQKEVHEDMAANFAEYPQKWGLKKADPNIDHRRVPNLRAFFTRKGKALPVTEKAENYKPGDIVTWDLDGKGMTHTGLVSNYWSEANQRYLIIHNIGGGAIAEDKLLDWKVTGHFRYF